MTKERKAIERAIQRVVSNPNLTWTQTAQELEAIADYARMVVRVFTEEPK